MTDILKHKGYTARPVYSAEDELFIGRLVGIDDVVTFEADRAADLRARFEAAVEDYIATCKQIGKPPQKPYSGSMMLRVDPQVHANAATAAALSGMSLNKWVEKAIDEAAKPFSPYAPVAVAA